MKKIIFALLLSATFVSCATSSWENRTVTIMAEDSTAIYDFEDNKLHQKNIIDWDGEKSQFIYQWGSDSILEILMLDGREVAAEKIVINSNSLEYISLLDEEIKTQAKSLGKFLIGEEEEIKYLLAGELIEILLGQPWEFGFQITEHQEFDYYHLNQERQISQEEIRQKVWMNGEEYSLYTINLKDGLPQGYQYSIIRKGKEILHIDTNLYYHWEDNRCLLLFSPMMNEKIYYIEFNW